MKVVVQRVKNAKVTRVSDGKVVGEIGKGLFLLFGVKEGDDISQAKKLAEKISKLRVMSDSEDKMNLSILETDSQVLVVSQFTLHAEVSKGNRPSFIKAARHELALKVYEHFVEELTKKGIDVQTGSFGDYMEIDSVLDGPVTIIYE